MKDVSINNFCFAWNNEDAKPLAEKKVAKVDYYQAEFDAQLEQLKNKLAKKTKNCEYCGKEFTTQFRQKSCSKVCSALQVKKNEALRNQRAPKPNPLKTKKTAELLSS